VARVGAMSKHGNWGSQALITINNNSLKALKFSRNLRSKFLCFECELLVGEANEEKNCIWKLVCGFAFGWSVRSLCSKPAKIS